MMRYAVVKLSGSIPSENYIYRIGRTAHKAWYYLAPEVGAYKEEISEQLKLSNVTDFAGVKDSISSLEIDLLFLVNKNFWKRDVTNMVKPTEDALSEAIGIDDSKNVKVSYRKILTNLSYEAIVFFIYCKFKEAI